MKRGSTAALRTATALSIALFALQSRQWIATGALVLMSLIAATRLRFAADRMLQLALGSSSFAVAWLLGIVLALPVDTRTFVVLHPIGLVVSLALLLTVTSRLMLERALGGAKTDALLLLLTLMFLADGQFGPLYISGAVLALACVWRGLWAAEPARPGWLDMDAALRWKTGAAGAIAASIALGVALLIPTLYPWMAGWVLGLVEGSSHATGFSTTLTLGALSGLRDNDARVLRVHGAHVDHLRGVSYDEYRFGRWVQSEEGAPRAAVLDRADASRANIEIETVGGDATRYFVPLAATSLTTEGGAARVDAGGILHTLPGKAAQRIRLRRGDRDRWLPAPPRARDIAIPEALEPRLRALALHWTQGAHGTDAQLAALSHHFEKHFSYALEFERSPSVDPVIDFLTTHRQGHCEYFASGFALLARSLGIPARVVGGYRVVEYNDLGGYYVVREQHAHAWVEAFVPGVGWQTHDPTPTSDAPDANDDETPWLAQSFDYAGYLASRFAAALTQRALFVLVGVLVAAWITLRLVRAIRARGERAVVREDYAEPPAALTALLAVLDEQGHAREPHEPLERYATRLATTPALAMPATALRDYSAHRYGGHGNAAELDRMLRRAARALTP